MRCDPISDISVGYKSIHKLVTNEVAELHLLDVYIKHGGLRKVICSNRSRGYPPKRLRFVHTSLSFWSQFGRSVQAAISRVHEMVHV